VPLRTVVLVPVIAACAAAASIPPAAARTSADLPARSQLVQDRQVFLQTAEQGLAAARKYFWNAKAGWYDDFLFTPANTSTPLARLWSAYPLFETLAAVAVADPSPANKAALRSFANQAATLYWNPNLKPLGGYEWYPGLRSVKSTAYFDDSGWWGLAFIDAYRATHDPAYLDAAHRAFVFIVGAGWDPKRGGVWWETQHRHKTIEPLAAGVLIGTWLYKVRHKPWYLAQVNKLLRWANTHSCNKARGLYQRNATDGTVMDYAQGLMIAATQELCVLRKQPALCGRARALANASDRAFPTELAWAPQNDVVYVRWMLDYYRMTGDVRWYSLAYQNAKRALANSRGIYGLFTGRWSGEWLADGLQEHAATIELFAWLAASPLPKA